MARHAILLLCAMVALIVPLRLAGASNETLWSSAVPPARFQGDNVAVVLFVADVKQHCNVEVPEGYTLHGCHAKTREGHSVIVVGNPCRLAYQSDFAGLMCHELGHANGWPRLHGD